MKSAIVAGVVLALVPAAHAQVGCDFLNKLVASSASGFADLRGEEISDGWYDAKSYLAGAEECSVDIGKADALFDCLWPEESEPPARTRVTALDLAVGKCLPAWTRKEMTGQSFNGLRINAGASYTKDAVSIEIHSETTSDRSETLVWFRMLGPPLPATSAASTAPAAPAAASAMPTGVADITSPTPPDINRVPRLEGLDLRYLAHSLWPRDTSKLDTVEFIDVSQVSRIGSRAYVWVLTTRTDPLVNAWAHYTLREVACGSGPQMRYIHSVHLGQDWLPNGTSVVNTSSKFEPGTKTTVQTVIDVACNGKVLPGPSYATPAEAAANRAKAALGER